MQSTYSDQKFQEFYFGPNYFGPEEIEKLENVLNSYLKLTLETKY